MKKAACLTCLLFFTVLAVFCLKNTEDEKEDDHQEKTVNSSIKDAEEILYGRSGSGKYPLAAYKIGDGKNTLVVTFAIHGYEDAFDEDGLALVRLGERLIRKLCQEKRLIRKKDWTVYVLPCLNPDGLFLGNSGGGPGRTTTYYYDEEDNLIDGKGLGVDLNRVFPYKFTPFEDSRNHTGDEPLLAEEARALAAFTESVKGEKANVLIDVHGWYQQILTTEGKGTLYKNLRECFPECAYTPLTEGCGYYSAWAGYELGFDSCLFELPKGIESMEDFEESDDTERFLKAILSLLSTY